MIKQSKDNTTAKKANKKVNKPVYNINKNRVQYTDTEKK